jgi:uncharacterized SAM-binding protein YcdF (DUF218 family)
VLGSAVLKNGAPSPAIRRRVNAAIGLHQSLTDSVLIMSGGTGRYGPSEASVMADLARTAGVRPGAILLEDASLNTRDNIQNSRSLIGDANRLALHIVSDAYHLPRCRMYLALAGIRARCHPAHGALREEPPEKVILYLAREAAGFVKYAWFGVFDRFA